MKTVKEVCKLTGVSARTLHHYDALGLLKPTKVTGAGYRLYDDAALERLYMILVFRELGFPLKQIGAILDDPNADKQQILTQQITLMEDRLQALRNHIDLAKMIASTGGTYMKYDAFDPKKAADHAAQAELLYGKTEAWQEYKQKSAGRSQQHQQALGADLMAHFAKLGAMRPCDPRSEEAITWAKELQEFISAHYYTCTPQILGCLAMSYADGGSMTENIDQAGGPGTGAFAKEVIDTYLQTL